MKFKIKLLLLLCVILVMSSAVAEASIFDDIKQRLSISNSPKTPAIRQNQGLSGSPYSGQNFEAFFYTYVKPYEKNTLIHQELERTGIRVLEIYVPEYKRSFYIVRNRGISINDNEWANIWNYKVEKGLALSKNDVIRVGAIISDNKITWKEKIELWNMVR